MHWLGNRELVPAIYIEPMFTTTNDADNRAAVAAAPAEEQTEFTVILAEAGEDLRPLPYDERRRRLAVRQAAAARRFRH